LEISALILPGRYKHSTFRSVPLKYLMESFGVLECRHDREPLSCRGPCLRTMRTGTARYVWQFCSCCCLPFEGRTLVPRAELAGLSAVTRSALTLPVASHRANCGASVEIPQTGVCGDIRSHLAKAAYKRLATIRPPPRGAALVGLLHGPIVGRHDAVRTIVIGRYHAGRNVFPSVVVRKCRLVGTFGKAP